MLVLGWTVVTVVLVVVFVFVAVVMVVTMPVIMVMAMSVVVSALMRGMLVLMEDLQDIHVAAYSEDGG